MEKVYDLHQHTHCVIIHIGKKEITISILPNLCRDFSLISTGLLKLGASISYNKQRTNVTGFGRDDEERGEDDIVIDDFCDGLYKLFKKDKDTWNEEDKFLRKAISDYLHLAVKKTVEHQKLKIDNFDLLHYVFVVPSEWEEEMRDDIIRPVFVQSELISKEDHHDRLLFFTDIESLCYGYRFEKGNNTILCRIIPEEEEIIIKFDLIQTTNTLFNIPNASLFPKVRKSSSVSVTKGDLERGIRDFLRAKLFHVATADDESLNPELVSSDQDQIIEAIMEEINSDEFSLEEEEDDDEEESWITIKKKWMLSESQKKFINSLRPSIICAGIGAFLLDHVKDIILNNSTRSYIFLFFRYDYSKPDDVTLMFDITWVTCILQYNTRSLNYIGYPEVKDNRISIMKGACIGVDEAIKHSDIYCNPRIVSTEDLSTSSSVFLNSKSNAIINLDISLKSTLFTCSILDEEGLTQHIFDHDYFIGDKHLPPLRYFYTFSNTMTLNVKKKFIQFAERYLLGDLNDLIADDNVSIKKDIFLKMKSILTKDHSGGKVLVSIDKQKYIKAFMVMYMIYIKEEILYKFLEQLISNQMDMKIGYAVSIEGLLLNNTVENKENLRDIIYASGLVSKDDHSKKLRITTQGEGILPAIQKSLKLELSLRSYFVLCQLHEDYVQLTLHQVVTEPSSEEKEQESIIVQDEILPIQNIYDSLCSSMWRNLLQDSSLIELCEMHDTRDNDNIINLLSSEINTGFFANIKGYISDNVLQNNPDAQSINAIKLNSSCNCKIRLTTSDIIDISFTPVLQDISHVLYASLLNKELFGNYMNIDYLFTFIRFNNNPQLQYAFTRILEEEADDFNLELGIDTSCLVIPELFSQLLQPVISHQPLCYNDFKIGALQQVSSRTYGFSLYEEEDEDPPFKYKSKITDTKTIECGYEISFPFLNKGEVINNVQSNRKFYLRHKRNRKFSKFDIDVNAFETMNYSENNETPSLGDKIFQHAIKSSIRFSDYYARKDVDVPVKFSIRYLSYTSSFQFCMKIVGADTKDKKSMGVTNVGEPLTLTRL